MLLAAALGAAPAEAQIGSERYAAIVTDARNGNVLVAANADEPRYPASLTKMMTLYMTFEALREGRLHLSTPIVVSEDAASRPPSKLGLPPGASLTVENAILALVTKSANDAASALGEHLGGGSEARFAQMMTMRARALGMSRTTFRNASGLPDPDQATTARDMAQLGRRLWQDFPERYHYFSTVQAQIGRIRLRNHNRMLDSYEGVDGIKTGYINASGFNIVTSANRGGVRLVGAVFGGSSWLERDNHMAALLDQGFERVGVPARSMPPPVVVASRSRPTLVRSASATTTRSATAVQTSARQKARVRQAPSRTQRTTAVRTSRIEQGDAAAPPASRTATRTTRTLRPTMGRQVTSRPATSRPATRAARPVTAEARRGRSG
jgi:D-alanyl-D-alanine carboxypeptidase